MPKVDFNANAATDALKAAKAQIADMTPVYEEIGEYLIEQRRQRFIRGVGPDGTAWPAKREATIARYKRLGYGTLNRPLIGPSRRLSREIQKLVSKNGVVVGSSLIYSRVMNDGAAKGAFGSDSRGRPIPWGRIPARAWIDLGKDEEAPIIEIVEEHVAAALGADN